MITTKRLYLTADRSRVVEEGDPAAAFLFAAKGSEIADHIARKMGICGNEQTMAMKAPAETRAVKGPRNAK